MATDTRVVLVKPGDVLIFGNVGDLLDCDGRPSGVADALDFIKHLLRLEAVLIFEADIDMAVADGKGA